MARSRSMRTVAWLKCEGICYLCGLMMLPEAENGHPLGYTLEHVIPKAKGGTNDLENLTGSHQYCNNAKGDALMEELPSGFRTFLRWKVKNLLIHQRV